jgi:hypothetical protein
VQTFNNLKRTWGSRIEERGNKERPGAGITLCTGYPSYARGQPLCSTHSRVREPDVSYRREAFSTMLLFCTKGGRNKRGQRSTEHGSRSVPRTGQIRMNT